MLEGEKVFANVDDIYVVCAPEWVGDVAIIEEVCPRKDLSAPWETQVWNRGGVVPDDTDILFAAAREPVPDAVVWRSRIASSEPRVEGPWSST